MSDLIIRFVVGGLAVVAFSVVSDLFKPKTFAGLFGAAPSVALASLVLTVSRHGKPIAATEARSMIIGGLAFLVYAGLTSYLILRFRMRVLPISISILLVWLGTALGLWYAVLS